MKTFMKIFDQIYFRKRCRGQRVLNPGGKCVNQRDLRCLVQRWGAAARIGKYVVNQRYFGPKRKCLDQRDIKLRRKRVRQRYLRVKRLLKLNSSTRVSSMHCLKIWLIFVWFTAMWWALRCKCCSIKVSVYKSSIHAFSVAGSYSFFI